MTTVRMKVVRFELRKQARQQVRPEKSPLATRYKEIKDDKVREIAILLDYDYWWEYQGRALSGWSPMEKPPGAACNALRRCLMLDSPTASVATKGMAREMIALLKAWGLDYLTDRDATGRPRFVFQLFFAFLSREQFDKRSLELEHSFVVFVKRLPEEPLYADSNNEDGDMLNKKVRKAWSQLTTKLGREISPNSDSKKLRTATDKAMDFDVWEKEYAQTDQLALLKDKGKAVPREIEQFVQRFRKAIKGQR
jgi:hypothetical protein